MIADVLTNDQDLFKRSEINAKGMQTRTTRMRQDEATPVIWSSRRRIKRENLTD